MICAFISNLHNRTDLNGKAVYVTETAGTSSIVRILGDNSYVRINNENLMRVATQEQILTERRFARLAADEKMLALKFIASEDAHYQCRGGS